MTINPIFLTDSYKLSHIRFESKGVQEIYSNFTPRFTKYFEAEYTDFDGNIVWFGLQYALKTIHDLWDQNFFKQDKATVIQQARRVLMPYIGMDNLKHFEALHDLGHLPIVVRSLPEGSLVTKGIPCFTIKNTDPNFQWLPNYLETILSAQLWKPMTVATVSRQFRLLSNEYALKTNGTTDGTEFQNHDFSFRGQSGWESSAINGAAFLLSSWGTDNIPALWALETYYNANIENEPIAFSVPAGEHSVTTLGITIKNSEDYAKGEEEFLKEIITEKFPSGIVSYVADSYDYWNVVTNIVPTLKQDILNRDGKLVIRGDSGDPVDIICGTFQSQGSFASEAEAIAAFEEEARDYFVDNADSEGYADSIGYEVIIDSKPANLIFNARIDCARVSMTDEKVYSFSGITKIDVEYVELTPEAKGTIQCLWETFGGTVNSEGYKVLDSHIGMIYGDGITHKRAKQIFKRLAQKGFSSINIVYGVGSYSLNVLSRDHLGSAVKATNAVVNGTSVPIYKAPKTDISKKSAKGLLQVVQQGSKFVLVDNVTVEEENQSVLTPVYLNGEFLNQTSLSEVRKLLWS